MSTAIATAIGTFLAIGVERRRASAAADALLFAPMIIPDIVLAIALLSFFTMLEFTLGLHSIIIAHVVFNIAFVCAVVRARLQATSTGRWSRCRADLGAGQATTFLRIILPLILPAVMAGAMLAFTLSIDEFIIAYLHRRGRAGFHHSAHADLFDDPLRRDARNQRHGDDHHAGELFHGAHVATGRSRSLDRGSILRSRSRPTTGGPHGP